MEPTTTEHARTPVFAAEGGHRHRLARYAIVAGAALLAAWLTSLALGILAGYDGLPGLPGTHSHNSTEASSEAPVHRAASATAAKPSFAKEHASGSPPTTRGKSRAIKPKAASPKVGSVTKPSTHGKSNSNGHGSGAIKPQGKPAGSPGNGPGGGGPPGQLR